VEPTAPTRVEAGHQRWEFPYEVLYPALAWPHECRMRLDIAPDG